MEPESKWQVTILGAGRPFRGTVHSALQDTAGRGRLLDWLLAAFQGKSCEFQFVGGYAINDIRAIYPELQIFENSEWESTRGAWSLLQAPLDPGRDQFVTYADIVYRPATIVALSRSNADIVVAIDSAWRTRYVGRPDADIAQCEKVSINLPTVARLGADIPPELANAEFVGLVRFAGHVIPAIRTLAETNPGFARSANLSLLVEALRLKGFTVQAIDVAGDWAELNEPSDLARFILGTKAETLARLREMVTLSRIEDQVTFNLAEWHRAPEFMLERVQLQFPGQEVVVRSSALSEDGFGTANAGAYDSVLHVKVDDRCALTSAITQVAGSYPDALEEHQILIQPMIQNVAASGVAFTRTLSRGAPYRVINYDDVSSATDTVTSGRSNDLKTFVIARAASRLPEDVPPAIRDVVAAVREIESLLHYDALDIEFAVDQSGTVSVLQVRPIAVSYAADRPSDDAIDQHLRQAIADYHVACNRAPTIVGSRPIFGVMPDWNPAEIIGTSPSRLALSLYDYLIMQNVWATQRAQFGYRDVRPHPLMNVFAGHPYVDVRASFNSFLPATLDDRLADRLVDHFLNALVSHPEWHDKIEFEIVPTCFGLDFERWEAAFIKADFAKSEIALLKEGLIGITMGAFAMVNPQFEKIELLVRRLGAIVASNLPPLQRVHTLLEDCLSYGSLPFAHLARLAFIAVTFLRSGVRAGVLRQNQVDNYLMSIRSVTHEFTHDAAAVASGELDWKTFVKRYGHLRPGTYDIESASYAEDPEAFLRPIVNRATSVAIDNVDGSHQRLLDSLSGALSAAGIEISPSDLDQFMRRAIEGREYAKFEFTRNLSLALDGLVEYGELVGIRRDELANLDIRQLLALRGGIESSVRRIERLKVAAESARVDRILASNCELPPLILQECDLLVFCYPNAQANFVGGDRIVAECVEVVGLGHSTSLDLVGKIALIEQADPGFDWLFGRGIGGLVTMYGGANSHMAIRAAEFGIPAAIGIGESAYRALARASMLELNAANRQLAVVR